MRRLAPINRHHVIFAASVASLLCAQAEAQFVETDVRLIQTFIGQSPADQFGWVSAVTGDLDGDGINDLFIGANDHDTGGSNAGAAYAYSSSTGQLLFRTDGPVAGQKIGHSVSGAGDVNADGVADVMTGGPGSTSIPGRVRVLSGADGSIIHDFEAEAAGHGFGFSVGSPGDINGDGHAELIIGAIAYDSDVLTNIGRIYVYSGADGSLIRTHDGAGQGQLFGSSAAGVGDVDGDGVGDYAAAAKNAGPNAGGLAYVYSGATGNLIHTLEPEATARDFGLYFLASPGDVDGDGVPDVYVSDFSDDRAYVFSGATGLPILVLHDPGSGGFGIGRGAGDVDNDGHADLLLAAWANGDGATSAGRAQIFSGADGSIMRTITSTTAGETFGFDAHPMFDDVDGDGLLDFVVTAAWNSENGTRSGKVYLIAGEPVGCVADFNDDGTVNTLDFLAYLNAFSSGDLSADINDDGVVNTLDFLEFLNLFSAGCP